MIKSGLLLPPPLYLPVGVKSARTRSVAAGSALFLDGYPPNGTKIYDHSGNGNDGTITGATWSRLRSGLWVLTLNGTTDYVDCGTDATVFPAAWSIKCWIKNAHSHEHLPLLGWGAANEWPCFEYQIYSDHYMILYLGENNFRMWQQNPIIVDNTWHLVVVTCPGSAQASISSALCYQDNGLIQALVATVATGAQAAKAVCHIGRQGTFYSPMSFGLFELIPSVITQSQVQQIYARERWLFGVGA